MMQIWIPEKQAYIIILLHVCNKREYFYREKSDLEILNDLHPFCIVHYK
jgi:hypothetical protein